MGSLQLDDFVAGWVGGAAGVIVGHPLDTVKTRLQAGQGYGSTFNCVRTVYKNEAVAGFFKGMSFPLISIAVYNAVVFGVFSSTQRFICQHRYGKSNHPPVLIDLTLASMATGAFSVGIGSPVELVKIRLQMQTQTLLTANLEMKYRATGVSVQNAYRGPIHCVATILQQEGLAGLYRGSTAMFLRDVPGYCLYFIPYAFVSVWITPEECLSPTPFSVWMAGGIAGIISWGTATPMDVVKSRLQADGVYLNKYKGVIDCICQSYHSEGLKVFFRGLTVNTLRGFPVSAATFLGYELSLKALRKEAETNP
ncbi:solute carrier family 25 member 48 [Python bivittatus]|uniref:Solute carrier family 25 member 48 n=1 Tax=Python bivittatus TaxID=176946 RepID=A0A9F2NPX6_PYTBI|nr:solute carrier family 25 member 48 [Python bivittatus]XP_025019404.1 solute carrier family 25 member 48 [Python bivittatus]